MVGRPDGALGEQRGQAHLLEQVEPVVAGRAVGAQPDVHARAPAGPATGAMPLASLRLEHGQCATWLPVSRSSAISLASRCTACTAIRPGTEQAQPVHALQRPHAEAGQALADLVLGLVQVQVDRDLQLLGVGDDLLEAAVAHRVGCVRRHAEGQQRLVPERIAHGQALVQVVLGVGGVGGGELDADDAERRAHARGERGARRPAPGRSTCR